MPRKSNFDDSALQAAIAGIKREMPTQGFRGYIEAARAFVEFAKKRTKLARENKIRKDYEQSGIAYAQAAEENEGGGEGAIKRAAEAEINARIRAIGYQRKGWKIYRIGRDYIEIRNHSRNSKFVKNTNAAGRYARRETLKLIPHLVTKKTKETAKKYSAKGARSR